MRGHARRPDGLREDRAAGLHHFGQIEQSELEVRPGGADVGQERPVSAADIEQAGDIAE